MNKQQRDDSTNSLMMDLSLHLCLCLSLSLFSLLSLCLSPFEELTKKRNDKTLREKVWQSL